jgi:hypothetical protein
MRKQTSLLAIACLLLLTAADAAHTRNDGTEEQACLDAMKDVQARIGVEQGARANNSPPAAIDPLRCEKKTADKKMTAVIKGSLGRFPV